MKTRRLGFCIGVAVATTSLSASLCAQPVQTPADTGQRQLEELRALHTAEREAILAAWGYPGSTTAGVGGGGTASRMEFNLDASTKDDAAKVWGYYVDKLPVLGGAYAGPVEPNSKKVPWTSEQARSHIRHDANGYIYVRVQPGVLGTIVMQNKEETIIITVTENTQQINKTIIELHKFMKKEEPPIVAPVDAPVAPKPQSKTQ